MLLLLFQLFNKKKFFTQNTMVFTHPPVGQWLITLGHEVLLTAKETEEEVVVDGTWWDLKKGVDSKIGFILPWFCLSNSHSISSIVQFHWYWFCIPHQPLLFWHSVMRRTYCCPSSLWNSRTESLSRLEQW